MDFKAWSWIALGWAIACVVLAFVGGALHGVNILDGLTPECLWIVVPLLAGPWLLVQALRGAARAVARHAGSPAAAEHGDASGRLAHAGAARN